MKKEEKIFKEKIGISFNDFYKDSLRDFTGYLYVNYPTIPFQDKEEILHSTYMTIIENIDKFDNTICNIKTYFTGIMNNNCNTFLKKKTFLTIDEDNYALPQPIVDNSIEINKSKLSIVLDKLSHFDEMKQDIFELHLNGFTHAEIASKLNIPIYQSKNSVFYVRTKLKEMVKEDFENLYIK